MAQKSRKSKVTLETILTEVRRTNRRIDQIELKNDDRFEFIKEQFFEVREKFVAIDDKFVAIDARFDKVDRSLELIATQTAQHIEQIKVLDRRVSKLEGLSA